jgi:hypothetical protein
LTVAEGVDAGGGSADGDGVGGGGLEGDGGGGLEAVAGCVAGRERLRREKREERCSKTKRRGLSYL